VDGLPGWVMFVANNYEALAEFAADLMVARWAAEVIRRVAPKRNHWRFK